MGSVPGFLTLVVLVAAGCAANPPAIQWSRYIASDLFGGDCVQQTHDGGYIAVGDSNPGGLSREIDMLLVRTDSLGNTIWRRTYGDTLSDGAQGLRQTPDGGFAFTAYIINRQTTEQAVVFKVDSLGNVQWVDSGRTRAAGSDVELTADGGYISVGSFGPPLIDDTIYLRKLDALGNCEWDVVLPALRSREWTGPRLSVQQTSDGGYVTGSKGIIKTDSLGNVQWSRNYSGVSVLFSIRQTSDGGYIATGIGSQVWPPWHKACLVLLKTDAQGNQTWKKLFRDGGPTGGRTVRQTSDGGYFVTGNSAGNAKGPWLLKTNSQGNAVWSGEIPGGKYESASWGEQTSDGGYVVLVNRMLVKLGPDGR
jgi:hypothetical protein